MSKPKAQSRSAIKLDLFADAARKRTSASTLAPWLVQGLSSRRQRSSLYPLNSTTTPACAQLAV